MRSKDSMLDYRLLDCCMGDTAEQCLLFYQLLHIFKSRLIADFLVTSLDSLIKYIYLFNDFFLISCIYSLDGPPYTLHQGMIIQALWKF